MATAREFIQAALKGRLGSLADKLIDSTNTTTSAAISALNTACDQVDQRYMSVDSSGAITATPGTSTLGYTQNKTKLISLNIIPNATSASSTVSYFTISVIHVNSTNNTGTVTVGTFTLSSAALTAGVPTAVTITSSLAEVSANRVLQIVQASVSAGVAWNYRVQAVVQEI